MQTKQSKVKLHNNNTKIVNNLFTNKTSYCNTASIPQKSILAKADSGASKHFFRVNDSHVLDNVVDDTTGPTVMLPDMTKITANKKGTVAIPGLSMGAKTVHILPNLKSASLLSMGQLCDDGCEITLTNKNIKVNKNDKTILKGYRNRHDGLWDIPIHKDDKNYKINVIIKKNTAKK